MKRVATNPRNAHRVASDLRIASCSNPQSVSGKYFINMKNPEDIVLLVNPNNNIFYCYTEAEFQRILNEDPPFVVQADRAPVSIERGQDPNRTFWVYKTEFGYMDKTLYDGYVAGSKTFKMVPVQQKETLLFKQDSGTGNVHDYPAVIHKVIPIDRDALLSRKGEIVKDESIIISEGKHQEIKEIQDILPDEEDELFDENEIREYLEKSESEKEEMLRVKREEKKKEEEEMQRIRDQRAEEMKKKIQERKQAGKYMAGEGQDPNRLLWNAAEDGNLAGVKQAIDDGADIHFRDDWALCLASEYGHFEIVKFLVGKGADVHVNNGYTLRSASENGHLEIVKFLVHKKVNIRGQNDYALRSASENGHLEVVKLLVENGADVHADDDFALGSASGNGHLEVVKFLVDNGADFDNGDSIALGQASRNGHLEIVKYLVKKGADVHVKNDYALRSACRKGHLDIVKLLVENGADVHADDDQALSLASENGHDDVVEYLRSLP
jgi:ankyrin repeat protein